MTISSTQSRVSYSGNGSTTAFTFPYKFLASGDLVVILRNNSAGTEATKVLGTDYTVSGAGGASGGTVTMVVAPPLGHTLTIYREVTPTQTLDLVENDSLPAEELEKAFDKAAMVAQRLKDLAGRTARLPEGYAGSFNPTLPTAAITGSTLIFGATGFEAGPLATEVANAQTYALQAAASEATALGSLAGSAANASAAASSALAAAASETAAAASALAAAGSSTSATTAKTAAEAAAANALTYKTAAEAANTTAQVAALTATSDAAAANTAKLAAQTAETNAAASALAASGSAAAASSSSISAAASATSATSSASAAASDAASALSSKNAAQSAAADALTYKTAAETAKTAAETAATTATTQAGIATTQAGIATTQAGIATTQAGIATTAATAASASALAAATSETNAAASASSFTGHTSASSGVHGLTGSVVGTSDQATLTNKKYEGGTASAVNKFVISAATKATLDALAREAGSIYWASDEQKAYIDNGTTLRPVGGGSTVTSSVQTISASGTITANTLDGFQMLRVKSNTSGGNSASTTPLGSSSYTDGQQFTFVGQDDDYPLTIPYSDTAKGCLLNGDANLFKGSSLTVIYDSTLNRFIEVSRNA